MRTPGTAERTPVNNKVRVLFVNTRSQIGADVAGHITLIKNFPADQVEVHLATNSNATDLESMRALMALLPHVRLRIDDLGHEISGKQNNKVHKLISSLKNTGAVISILRLSSYVRRHKIDVLHSTDRPRDALLTTLLSRLSGCPNVIHFHNAWSPEMGGLTNWGLEKCTGVLAISEFTRLSLLGGGVADHKIHTVLNAIDPTQFDPNKITPGVLRREWGIGKNTPVVGIVARPILWKGHMELVEALAQVKTVIPAVRLVIVGATSTKTAPAGNPFVNALRQRISELDLTAHVVWAGWHDDMPGVMSDMDVVAVPSWEEPFGLVVTEAMAMERPVVGYCSGGLPEIITDGVEGLLVPHKDITALASALTALLSDPERRAEMGRRGRQRVLQHFNPQRFCTEMEAVYRKVASFGS